MSDNLYLMLDFVNFFLSGSRLFSYVFIYFSALPWSSIRWRGNNNLILSGLAFETFYGTKTVVSLSLHIPQYWPRHSWVFYPIPHELWSVPVPSPMWVPSTVCSILSGNSSTLGSFLPSMHQSVFCWILKVNFPWIYVFSLWSSLFSSSFRAHLLCFLFLRDHRPWLPGV